ncbi:MAG: hypothetical protein ACYTES_13235, partial [Planctomycetota bacterium]
MGGGAIVRAESWHLVKVLNPPIKLVHDLGVSDTAAAILDDTAGRVQENELKRRWFEACKVDQRRGRRFVPVQRVTGKTRPCSAQGTRPRSREPCLPPLTRRDKAGRVAAALSPDRHRPEEPLP